MAGMRNFWLNIPRSVSAVRALELSKEASIDNAPVTGRRTHPRLYVSVR
jgi:hypothetical protein